MIKDERDGRECLGPHLDDIRECIEYGFNRYLDLPPEFLADITPRSRASLVHDFIRAEAKRRFYDDPEIECHDLRGLFLVDFGEIQLRFKKFNRQFLPQNIPTKQTEAFMIQEPLPGIPLATKVIAGYQADMLHHAIQCIAIGCPQGRRYRWFFPIEKTLSPVVPLGEHEEHEGGVLTTRVTVKEGLRDEDAGDKDI